jgi:hypothetical protein
VRILEFQEGAVFTLADHDIIPFRNAMERLQAKLRPRGRFLSEQYGTFTVINILGSIDVGTGLVINILPKIDTGGVWITSVVELLTGRERVEVAGERQAELGRNHTKLGDALAEIYLRRLQKAFRQDGPILLMEKQTLRSQSLNGKLNVSKWVKDAAWRPHEFPISRTRLAPENPYSSALVVVGTLLGKICTSVRIRSSLAAVCRDLSPGVSNLAAFDTNLILRSPLPDQWRAYKPAWAIVQAVLSRASLLGPKGNYSGLSLAIESWPLLETALERLLFKIEELGVRQGRTFTYSVKGKVPVIRQSIHPYSVDFSAEPDGRLYENGGVLAAFDAKYKIFNGTPDRNDIYQVITTAAACNAPFAILIYPQEFPPKIWDIQITEASTKTLVTIGIGLFSWSEVGGIERRARVILDIINTIDTA